MPDEPVYHAVIAVTLLPATPAGELPTHDPSRSLPDACLILPGGDRLVVRLDPAVVTGTAEAILERVSTAVAKSVTTVVPNRLLGPGEPPLVAVNGKRTG